MDHSENFKTLIDAIQIHKHRLVALVVHLNDTYLIEARGHRVPGFPKLIATIVELRKQVREATGEDRLLVLHSGDFLGPSLLAKADKGKAMVEMLKRCGLDYCVIGNHEFDHKLKALSERLKEAWFGVVLSNVTPERDTIDSYDVAFWPGAENPVVAIAGVVSRDVSTPFPKTWKFVEPAEALERFVERTSNVQFHIALSHATRADDRVIRAALKNCPRAIVLGGHDHDIGWFEDDDYPIIYKNLSNLQTVRVLMLLAAGDHAMSELIASYRKLKVKNAGKPPPYTAENVEQLLEPLHVSDAAVFRAWMHRTETGAQSSGVSVSTFDDDDDLPPDGLVHRLAGVQWSHNQISWKLTPQDLLAAEKSDRDWVEEQLGIIRHKMRATPVHDFSGVTTEFEARDTFLRGGPTDFGQFVAETVRRHADADIAILNAGACRCDDTIPAQLTEHILNEAFLYDRDDAVIVIEMCAREVDALLAHGLSRLNSGAYVLFAGSAKAPPSQSKVAIASYVLTDPDSTDGYAEVLAALRGVSVAALRSKIATNARAFSVVEAVKVQASHVKYQTAQPLGPKEDPASAFIRLAGAFRRAYVLAYGDHQAFSGVPRVMKDGNLVEPELRAARDSLRDFLEKAAGDDPAETMLNLQHLQKAVSEHRAVFADAFRYDQLFNYAAECVPPWKA